MQWGVCDWKVTSWVPQNAGIFLMKDNKSACSPYFFQKNTKFLEKITKGLFHWSARGFVFHETFKIVNHEDELDLLSVVAVTQIGPDGRAHLDLHCNEHGILLKTVPFLESWDVVSRKHSLRFMLMSPYTPLDIPLHIQCSVWIWVRCLVQITLPFPIYKEHKIWSKFYNCDLNLQVFY